MRIARAGGWVAVRGDATAVFRSTKQHSKNAILIAQADFRGAVCRAVVPRKAPLDLRGTDGELVRQRRPDSDIDVLAVLETLAGDYGDEMGAGAGGGLSGRPAARSARERETLDTRGV